MKRGQRSTSGSGRRWHRGALTIACIFGLCASALAQQPDVPDAVEPSDARRYSVEIILFAYSDGVASGREEFPPDTPAGYGYMTPNDAEPAAGDAPVREYGDRAPVPAGDDTPDGADLRPIPIPGMRRVHLLTKDQLTLKSTYDKLAALDAYRPVLWTGWTQLTYERDATPAIHLHGLGNVADNFDGTLKLYLSRFLHLVVDLSMRAPSSAAAARPVAPAYGNAPVSVAPAIHYRIEDDRIMKNGELRYFDHPKFGLLAKVTRAAPAPGTGAPEDAATATQ